VGSTREYVTPTEAGRTKSLISGIVTVRIHGADERVQVAPNVPAPVVGATNPGFH